MTLERQLLDDSAKTFRAIFMESLRLDGGPWSDFCMQVGSTGKSNEYDFLGASPAVAEWIGDRPMEKVKAHAYTITNQKWANGLRVKAEDIEDDNLGLYAPLIRQMARNFELHKMKLLGALIAGGFADANTYDGQYFFDSDHQDEAETAQSNTAVTTLGATNFEAAVEAMMNFTDSKGDYLGIFPTHLAVPPQLRAEALKIAEQEYLSSGEKNINRGLVKVVVLPWLSASATNWFLFDLSKEVKPFIYQQRTPVTFAERDRADDSNVFDQDEYHYGGRARYAMGYGFWQCAWGSTGAGS